MRKLAVVLGATIGGALGWWVGAFAGIMTAFIVSTICSGVGMYAVRRWYDQYYD